MIYCIDEDATMQLYSSKLQHYFQDMTIYIKNNLNEAFHSIADAVKKGYDIPVVITGQTIFNTHQDFFLNRFSPTLNKTKLIVLMDDLKIESLSNSTYDFLHFLPKSWIDIELVLTIREFIKSYWQDVQIERSYNTDSLTGLYNRNLLEKQLTSHVDIGLLLLNLDDFRLINSAYGYKFGDILLQEFAAYLLKNFPKNQVYRLISNEFVILLGSRDKERALVIAEILKENINKHLFTIGEKSIYLTLCIAIANEGENLIERAQNTIYKGRQNSKNRIFIADTPCAISDILSFNALQNAINEDRVIPYYQGIRNNKTGSIERYECLVRIQDGDTIISPSRFIDEARKTGLITKITRKVIEKSFRYFSKKLCYFSINITEDDLKENYLVPFIKEMSLRNFIDLRRVMLEIVESMNLEDNETMLGQIHQLKELGCTIAFDDFGCERSNFSRMLELNIDIIKIDGRFIKNIHQDEKSYKLTKAITNMAKDMNCKVVAECIECEEAQKIIDELDIDYTQGYLYSKPSEKVENYDI